MTQATDIWYTAWQQATTTGSGGAINASPLSGEVNPTWYAYQALQGVWQTAFQVANRTAPQTNWATQVAWTTKNDAKLLQQNNNAQQVNPANLYSGSAQPTLSAAQAARYVQQTPTWNGLGWVGTAAGASAFFTDEGNLGEFGEPAGGTIPV